MKKWTLVDQTLSPDGQTLTLHEHDGDYAIRIDGVELMSTRAHASEEQLGTIACTHLGGIRNPRVLVGGLGFGYTLRSVLASVGRDATVVVVELLAAVVAWSRTEALKDPRVQLVNGDVYDVIRKAKAEFDSIILDVDNGAAAFTYAGNARIYESEGLAAIRIALRPKGCAAFWSAAANPAFQKALRRAGFKEEAVRAGKHTVFVAFVN